MKKSFILPVIAVIMLFLVALKIFQGCNKDSKQGVTAGPPPPVQAECYLVRDTIVEFPLRAVGYLRANERVDVVSEISGRISSILFREGSMVSRGTVLFQLDDSEYTASLRKNVAELELAVQAEARNSDLLKSGGLSLHQYEESVSHRKVLEAQGDYLRVMIEKAKIRAPFTGKAGIRRVSDGAYVSPGETLTTLEDLSILEIDFSVPQDQAGSVRVGDRLQFRAAGNPEEFGAVVEAIDPSVDRKTGNLWALAKVDQGARNLVAGTSVTVSMVNRSPVPALYVPTQALLPTAAGYNVYQVVNGKCSVKHVGTGIRSDQMVEVTEGIKGGDTILVTGFMRVKPGNMVRIKKIW